MLKSKEPIVLVLASDQGYFDGLWITLVSLLIHTETERKIKIYIFDGGIGVASKDSLTKELNRINSNITIDWLIPDLTKFESFLSMGNNYLAYSRILIPNMIVEPKVIWLDVDLLVLYDIELLWKLNLGDFLLGASLESPEATFTNDVCNAMDLDIPEDAVYFNSGILVMNNEALLKAEFTSKCFQFLEQNKGNYKWHDQSAINVVGYGQIKILDRSWNYLNSLQKKAQADYDLLKNSNYIYHFLQRPKPWQKFSNTIHAQLLYKIAKISGLELVQLKIISNRFEQFKWRYPALYYSWIFITDFFNKKSKEDVIMVLEHIDYVKTYQKDIKPYKQNIKEIFNKIEEIYYAKVKSNT